MATKLSICNQALALLGEPPVTSDQITLAEQGASVWIGTFYTPTLQMILREAPWHEFLDRGQLTLDSDLDPSSAWLYSFMLPESFIEIWGLALSSEALGVDHWQFPYRLEGDYLLANDPEVWCVYTRLPTTCEIVTEELFSPELEEAMVCRLAAKLSIPLTGKMDRLQYLTAVAAAASGKARAKAYSRDCSVVHRINPILSARRGQNTRWQIS